MSIQSYPAIFHEDIDGVSVCVPDLPYVLTCGRNFDEAYKMAVDAIAGYIDLSRQDGEEIPEPSDPSAFADRKNGGYIVMVTADFDDYIEKVFNAPVGRLVVLTQTEAQNAEHFGVDLSRLLKKALKEEFDRQREERRKQALELANSQD